MTSTWEPRDLPVLQAIVALSDEGNHYIEPAEIAERTGFDEATVQQALWALADEDPPLFTYTDSSRLSGPAMGPVSRPTGHARRKVGTWPTPDSLADRIIEALDAAADQERDPERKSKLRGAVDFLSGVGRGVLTEVTAKVITTGVGL
jgi:hypothetical protein